MEDYECEHIKLLHLSGIPLIVKWHVVSREK